MAMNETTGKGSRSVKNFVLSNWRQNIIYIGFAVIFLIFALTLHDKGFLNPTNLLNIIRQTAMIAVMAIAMTFVLSCGEIDLSVGAVAGLTSVTVAMAIDVGGIFFGIGVGLATGIAVGVFNGLLTTRIGIPSFLTTLAMMGIAKGVAMWISDTAAVPIIEPAYSWLFGGGSIGIIPVLAIWMLVLGIIGHFSLKRTSFGRRVLATGGGEQAARYSGIDTNAVKFKVLIISSMAAAVAGMLYAGRLQSGRFQLGEGDELSVIAAAVLGGTSLFGGYGTVIGTIVGALMIGLINNGLILMGLEFSQQLIARGGIIILAVALSQKRSLLMIPGCTIIGTVVAKPETREELQEILAAQVAPTRAEEGCLNYDFHVDAENDCVFVFYENWNSQRDLDEHLRKPHLKPLFDRQGELLSRPVEIRQLNMLSDFAS